MSWTWSDTSTLPIETPWMWPEQGDSTGTKGGCKMSQNKASRATERKREGEGETDQGGGRSTSSATWLDRDGEDGPAGINLSCSSSSASSG